MTVGGPAALGWDEWHEAEWQAAGRPGPVGRAARVDRGWGSILLAVDDERRCTLEPGTEVAVGDWVVVDTEHDRVSEVLPRRSVLARRAADKAARAQILATNVDIIFLVHALSHAPNTRRLERELVLAFESGASPVVVLNKADVVADPAELAAAVAEVEATALAVPVVRRERPHRLRRRAPPRAHRRPPDRGTRRAVGGREVDARQPPLRRRRCRCSGPERCGPSTRRAATPRRRPSSSSSTTVACSSTRPGCGPWPRGARAGPGTGLARAFQDVTTLAEQCRFADCRHDAEPGCAVREAVDDGRLDPRRLASWQHLTAELERLAGEQASITREARRGRPPRVVESSADDVAGDD